MTTAFIRIKEDDLPFATAPGPIARVLARILPKGNPDFEHLYDQVSYWYLEVTDSRPTREVGFDRNGLPIVIGPHGENHGLWVDSAVLLDPADYPLVSPEEFSAVWRSFANDCRDNDRDPASVQL